MKMRDFRACNQALSGAPPAMKRPAKKSLTPTARGPLNGVRVVDLSRLVAITGLSGGWEPKSHEIGFPYAPTQTKNNADNIISGG